MRKKRSYTVTNSETRGEHLKPHEWKKGQSGNPKGRPPNALSLITQLRVWLNENPEDAKKIIKNFVRKATEGEMRAIEEMFNRIDGKVVEKHEISGEMPVRIIFVPAEQLLKKEGIEEIKKEVPL